jgi:four helix bundle protein
MDRFEDSEAWQRARELAREIYKVTASGNFARDFALRDQIRRAAVSIMSNIAEGFERNGLKEFIYFLGIAKGSAGEVRAQLYIALDAGFLDQESFNRISTLAQSTSQLIAGFKRALERRLEGVKR